MGLGTGLAVLNSQVVPISQVVAKTGFTVCVFKLIPSSFTSTVTCHSAISPSAASLHGSKARVLMFIAILTSM